MVKDAERKSTTDIAIWGHPPPPFGGMTVHISRLLPKLKENNISYNLYSFDRRPNEDETFQFAKNIKWLSRMLIGNTENVHYIITVRPWVRFLAVLFGIIRKKKIILRIGGASLHRGAQSGSIIKSFMSKFAVRNASAVIGVNDDICKLAISLGAQRNKVHKIPGFIFPQKNGSIRSPELNKFLDDKWPRIITTGRIVNPHQYDMYGIGMSIDMIESLIERYPNIGFVVFSQNEDNNTSNDNLYLKLNSTKLKNTVVIIRGTFDFIPTLEMCDVFVRPTHSDGDANSIREALFLKTPVVASDCVVRPPGCRTFQSGNLSSFIDTMRITLNNLDNIRKEISTLEFEDNSKAVIDIIKQFIN